MKEKYLYNYSFDEFVKTIKHYCNLLYLSKNLIVFKYMISILTILLLHTNNLYAQAKRTDTVSILRSDVNGCEESCRDKCTFVKYELVEVKRERREATEVSKSSSYFDSSWCVKNYFWYLCADDRSTNGYYHKVESDIHLYKSEIDVIFYKLVCSFKGVNHVELLKSDNTTCENVAKDKINKCISECRKQKDILMIGNKEIKTVGDLLDSIPATELLKIYDPNMVYQ